MYNTKAKCRWKFICKQIKRAGEMMKMDFIRELGERLTRLSDIVDSQQLIIEDYRLKAAMYKAYFFHKSELAKTLEEQIKENYDYSVGEFDGFCYASWRAKAVYTSLENMVKQGIITESDYRFCKC